MFTDTSRDRRARRVRREIIVWGYFLALIAGILLFGFRITVPVFLIAFLRFQAEASWRNALIYGGAGAIVMFVLFEKVLRVALHTGLPHRLHRRPARFWRAERRLHRKSPCTT